jgi:hypothetical protein
MHELKKENMDILNNFFLLEHTYNEMCSNYFQTTVHIKHHHYYICAPLASNKTAHAKRKKTYQLKFQSYNKAVMKP